MRVVVNLCALIELLQRMDAQPVVSRRELCVQMKISPASLHRLLTAARNICGVHWEWDMKNGYRITHWGLFDSRKVRQWKLPAD